MMRNLLNNVASQFHHPEVPASTRPLVLIVSTFILISGALIFYILKLLRSTQQTPELSSISAHQEPSYDRSREIIHHTGKFRGFLRRTLGRVPVASENADALQSQVRRLEDENLNTREMYTRAVARIDELRDELKVAESKYKDLALHLEGVEEIKKQALEKSDAMQSQLDQLTKEVDDLQRTNVHATGFQMAAAELPGLENAFTQKSTLDLERSLTEKDEEIRKLKELLHVCRDQIVAFTTNYRAGQTINK